MDATVLYSVGVYKKRSPTVGMTLRRRGRQGDIESGTPGHMSQQPVAHGTTVQPPPPAYGQSANPQVFVAPVSIQSGQQGSAQHRPANGDDELPEYPPPPYKP
ncbi:hypothetical protein H4219_003502 [Mycoemilia scoparia]|uniref:Uncharacterized protein n=1 Tax=Mycoemilia scoparia TaxID=417184 RepID=A0A9W7ZYM0_9FUNG|nr:hypothetical protein H4219_003502 [Mycoemilia scoparia]